MMNEQAIKGQWREFKGEIQKAWGKLTDDELEKTKGDLKAVSGLVQQKYGESQEQVKRRMDDLIKKFENQKDSATQKIKNSLRN